jgi:hypothetical protein
MQRSYASRDYVRNQLRSTKTNDIARLRAILRRYRGAVLDGDRRGLRAMGRELKGLGGEDAMMIGVFTAPMNPATLAGARVTKPGRYTDTKTEKIIWEEWPWSQRS